MSKKFMFARSAAGQTVWEYMQEAIDELYCIALESNSATHKAELKGALRLYVLWHNFQHSDKPITLQDALRASRNRIYDESYSEDV